MSNPRLARRLLLVLPLPLELVASVANAVDSVESAANSLMTESSEAPLDLMSLISVVEVSAAKVVALASEVVVDLAVVEEEDLAVVVALVVEPARLLLLNKLEK